MPDLTWQKSSHSGCIEIAWLDSDRMLIRNSKNPGPAIVASRQDWDAFVAAIQAGEFEEDVSA